MLRIAVRIALLHPTYWPEVRRGAERLVHDVATGLARRGHEVALLTSSPGPRRTALEEGVRVVRSRRLPSEFLDRRGFEHHLTSAPAAFAGLLSGRYDVAHACFGVQARAAVAARRLGGPPVVFTMTGLPDRRTVTRRRRRLPILRAAARGAAVSTALSDTAARAFCEQLGVEAVVVPGGVFCEEFAADVGKDPRPTIVCAASAGDPRKRVSLLLRAFEHLRGRRPDARLVLAGGGDPRVARHAGGIPPEVEWLQPADTRALAGAYARAWASVMPSVDEAFGLVLIESLAAGTPAVAARSGAGPEVLSSDRVGRLFRADDEADLARALEEALELGRATGTADACRRHARLYDWENLLPRYEELYRRALEASR